MTRVTKEELESIHSRLEQSKMYFFGYTDEAHKVTTPKQYGMAIQGRRRKKKGKAIK